MKLAYQVNVECLRLPAPRNTSGILPTGAFSCVYIEVVFGIVTQAANQGIDIAALRKETNVVGS